MAMPGVAAAQETAVPQVDDTTEQEIVVQGYRASLATADAIKKDSDDIVDSLVAEDIGKLPDSTGAESLARITGVQVDRLNGEAGGVRLRGLPNITTTYNGREIFTAEGRNVALQDFPAASVSRFDVYKTAGANMVEAGIAGEIDVKSHKPFDFKGTRIVGGVTGLHWRQSQEFGVDANLLISNRWNTGIGEMGLLIEGSYTDNKFVDSYRDDNTAIFRHAANVVVNGQPNYPNVRYPQRVSFQYPSSDRFRPSAAASFQWRPSQNFEFYADFLFQGFRAAGESSALHFDTGSNAPLYDVTLCPNSTDLVCQMTMRGAGNGITGYQVAQWNKTDTYQGGSGFIWKVPGGGRITGDVAKTDSRNWNRNMQFNIFTNSLGTRVFNFDDQSGGGGASAYVTDIDLSNPASWRMLNFAENGANNHGTSFQARLDADLPIKLAIFDRLQAGVRYSNRDADSYNDPAENRTPVLGATDPRIQYVNLPLDFNMSMIGFRGDPTVHPRTWITPTRQSIIHNADYLRMLVGQPAGYPKMDWVYSAGEKSYAAYIQTHYKFPLGTMEVDGQIGLRAVRTTNDVLGTLKIGSGAGQPYSKDNNYLDLLPNVSARLKLSRTLQARLSFTKTRTRPDFGSLNPTLTVNATLACDNSVTPPVCNYRTASGGNPDLQPIQSTNYDASLEYYFSRSGSATVQIFRRDVTGFINNATVFMTDPDLGPLRVDRPENGQKGYIQGVEAGFRTFFKLPSLPQWVQNFGILANFTYLDHGSELSPSAAATLPGVQPLSGVSNYLANAQIFYDSKPLSLRLSYNWRSKFQTYGVVTDPAVTTQLTLPTVEKDEPTVDFSGSLNPTDNVSLNVSIANLLGSKQRTTRAFNAKGDTYPVSTRYLETVYRVGVRFRF
ncbi:TonB-dependent receptor [Sphingomonas sp. R-74633]|uniref:TonB-dependent receptor n=1 Tax=Sphingomonas sp. R-74633 TaxID=2751188 RepID=UPI0015D32B86|nr:TonB-dependent receptor [Sphingomonas sp. R-74633]